MNTTMWVGAQFRCANEKIVDLGVFESMLAAMAYACGPLTLTDYFTCTTSGIGQQRSVSTPENLIRLWNRKTTVALHLQSSRRMDDGPYASVFFGRSDRPGGEVPPTSGEVTLYRTVSGDEHANFLLGLKRAFVLADGWSGHVHATTEGRSRTERPDSLPCGHGDAGMKTCRRSRSRHLAKTVMQGGNLLLLDEPTNDLDVDTLRALEDAVLDFSGCAVIISHDRWFLDRVATHILAFEGDREVVWFEGNYGAYIEDLKKRKGPDADHPHRIKYKKLVR